MTKSTVLAFAAKNKLTVTGLTFASQEVKPGFVFFALKGAHVDGNLFVQDAVARGAVLVVSAQAAPKNYGVPFLHCPNIEQEMADCAYEFYGHPSDNMHLWGITGTKGKTSIAYLMESILQASGHKTGVFGTVNYRANNLPSTQYHPGGSYAF